MAEEQSLLKYRVMIVDDEPMAVKAIERIIERNCPAFTVVGKAGNGREALEMLSEAKPDLVLHDIAMPLMSGLELAKAGRTVPPEELVPVYHRLSQAERERLAREKAKA